MTRRSAGTALRWLLAFAAASATAQSARAAPPAKGGAGGSTKTTCLAAHEDALALRSQKKPHAAREKLVECSRVECPTVVRKECAEQLALVDKDAPTVVLEALGESGMDTTAVKVSMDGNPFAERLTGSGVDVEPGEHVFRFERADGKVISQRVLVVEGEKNRKVVADFASLVPKPPPATASPVLPHEPRTIPVIAYVAGGIAIVGLGGFTFFALTGKGAEKDLASSCGPNCKNDQLSPVKRDYLIADISLAIGVVAAVSALILAWPAITDSPKTTATVARLGAPPPWMPRVTVRAR